MSQTKILFSIRIFLAFFLLKMQCIDIKMSLGKISDENNIYPLFITVNEPLKELEDHNSIDLFCIYELNNDKSYLDKLNSLLVAIMLGLNSKDRLGIISLTNPDLTKTLQIDKELSYITEINKNEFMNGIKNSLINSQEKELQNFYNFKSGIKKFKGIINNNFNKSRVNSVIFILFGSDTFDYKFSDFFGDEIYKNFSFHFLVFNSKVGEKQCINMINFAKERDGGYYEISSPKDAFNSTLNIIGGLKTIKYKYIDFNIQIYNNAELNNFYGSKFLSSFREEKKLISFSIYQYISGIDYTYVLLLSLNEDIKAGDIVLSINATYENYNQKTFSKFTFIRFYKSANYLFYKKGDYCRVKIMESLQKENDNKNKEKLRNDCKNEVKEDILNLLDNYDYTNSYRIIAEGYIRRGGINLWNSNNYQKDLIEKNKYIIKS